MSNKPGREDNFSLISGSLSGEDETEGHAAHVKHLTDDGDKPAEWSKQTEEWDDAQGHTVISKHITDPKR